MAMSFYVMPRKSRRKNMKNQGITQGCIFRLTCSHPEPTSPKRPSMDGDIKRTLTGLQGGLTALLLPIIFYAIVECFTLPFALCSLFFHTTSILVMVIPLTPYCPQSMSALFLLLGHFRVTFQMCLRCDYSVL